MYKNAWKGNAESLARKSSLDTMRHPLDYGKRQKKEEKSDKPNKKKVSGNQSRFSRQLLNVSFVSKAFRDITSHSRVKLIHALWVTLEKHEKKEVAELIVQSDTEKG